MTQVQMNHLLGDDLIVRRGGLARVVKFVGISAYWAKVLLEGFHETWVLGTSFVHMIDRISHGIGNVNVF